MPYTVKVKSKCAGPLGDDAGSDCKRSGTSNDNPDQAIPYAGMKDSIQMNPLKDNIGLACMKSVADSSDSSQDIPYAASDRPMQA